MVLAFQAILSNDIWLIDMNPKGKSSNLAPFSYFNVVNHDPPIFIFGFSGGLDRPKDTLRNLVDTKECTNTFHEKSDL
jgi:flavin reductase (DIM6/NTAB) family NADH-FMN oxidoreductase RutF